MPQTLSNHVRWFPPYHFFVMPVLVANFIVQAVAAVRAPSLPTIWAAVVAFALALGLLVARVMALRVQDRVIRAEERLRLERLVPQRRALIDRLGTAQLIAIRFASDEEVAGLLDRIEAGELGARRDIKRAVRNWRADYLRA